MPENPEQRYKLESYVTNDADNARDHLLKEAYPVAKETREYLDKTPNVRAYIDAAQRSNDAEGFMSVLGLVTLVTGMAYRAGLRGSGYGLATAAVLGMSATIAKATASNEMEEAAEALGAPKYSKLLEAGDKSNSGNHIELTAATLAWSAGLPMAGLAFGKAGRAVDVMAISLGLGAASLRHLRSKDTGMVPVSTAVEDLVRSEKAQGR